MIQEDEQRRAGSEESGEGANSGSEGRKQVDQKDAAWLLRWVEGLVWGWPW